MIPLTSQMRALHEHALRMSENFRKAESSLIAVLQKIDDQQVYLAMGFGSLFEYALSLNLSEANAYAFCAIARKAKEIPEIKSEIDSGRLTVSKARRILPVITRENKTEWLQKAQTLSKNALENEVIKEKPELLKRETIRHIQPDRLSVSFSISDELLKKIKRAQDLLSSQKRKPMKLEESLEELVEDFLERKDPLRKAQKSLEKLEKNKKEEFPGATAGGKPETIKGSLGFPPVQVDTSLDGGQLPDFGPGQKRKPIPAAVKHALVAHADAQCTYVAQNGIRCQSQRWLDLHHKHPVAKGGSNTRDNLILLCKAHHALLHRKSPAPPHLSARS